MKTKIFILSAALFLAAFCLTGCVSQKEYDALLAERDALLEENESLKGDVAKLQDYAAGLQKTIEEQEAEISDYEEELDAKTALVEDLSAQVASLGEQLAEVMAAQTIDKEKVMETFEEAKDAINNAWQSAKDYMDR